MSTLPRVTHVLQGAGLVDLTWVNDEARDRGSRVHAATHYLDEGDLDRSSLDPGDAPIVGQYERFKREVRPEIVSIEEEVTNATWRYAGRLDRRVVINGREGVLDIKGICASPWHGAQLAAYAACFSRPLARWNVYLSPDSYRLVERKDRDDWKVFVAALTLVNWKARNAA